MNETVAQTIDGILVVKTKSDSSLKTTRYIDGSQGLILDVLEEISETGDYILRHRELYPYVERKVAGGMNGFHRTLMEYKEELRRNSTPDMIKSDAREVEKMKKALEVVDKAEDPTVGAGMGMEQLMEKLLKNDDEARARVQAEFQEARERKDEDNK